MVVGTTGGAGTRAISKRFPAVDGLTAGTTNQVGRITNLIYQQSSKVPLRLRIGRY